MALHKSLFQLILSTHCAGGLSIICLIISIYVCDAPVEPALKSWIFTRIEVNKLFISLELFPSECVRFESEFCCSQTGRPSEGRVNSSC